MVTASPERPAKERGARATFFGRADARTLRHAFRSDDPVLLSTTQLKDLLERTIPDAKVQVRDLTGTSDHFAVDVTSPVFAGKSLIEQHRIVQAACGEHLGGAIHAIQIKTRVPA